MSLMLYLRHMQKEVMPKVSVMPSMTRKLAFFNTILLNLFLCFYLAGVLRNKNSINNDLGYYGVPFNAIKTFIYTCPSCVPNKVAPKRTKMQPLKMILSKKVGSRFQMDLIKMLMDFIVFVVITLLQEYCKSPSLQLNSIYYLLYLTCLNSN
jgi:hypothetical protein